MRMTELDCIRGFALVTITVNHIGIFVGKAGYDGFYIPTLTRFGYSSAAELFFLISGYLLGYTQFGRGRVDFARSSARLAARACNLLAMNCVLFVFIFSLLRYFPLSLQQSLGFAVVPGNAPLLAKELLTLGYNLTFLDILNFYILLLLAAIPFGILLMRSTVAACLLIVALYLVANKFPQFSMPGGNLGGSGYWTFNPLAWQFLFLGSMVAGRFAVHEHFQRIMLEQPFRRAIVAVSVALFVIFDIVYVIDAYLPDFSMPMVGLTTLAPIRLAHALVTFLLLAALLTGYPLLRNNPVYRLLVLVGKHSLICFMGSIALTYVAVYFWYYEQTTPAYLALCAAAAGLLILIAFVAETLRNAQRSSLGEPARA